MNRIFFYPGNESYVMFTEQTQLHMYAHAQRRFWQKEAGGEIFSNEPYASALVISSAHGPSTKDYRSRCSWNPDTFASDINRNDEFAHRRHAVGLWHTHPEKTPLYSTRDRQTTVEYLNSFYGDRSRYLMVIIGNGGRIPAMGVWVATAAGGWIKLRETE